MNVERLTKMVELLRRIDEDRELASIFSLDHWLCCNETVPLYGDSRAMHIMSVPPQNRMKELVETAKHTCGTSACALGFAAMDPWFVEQGLTLDQYGPVAINDKGNALASGFGAAAVFFDIPSVEAIEFFDNYSYDQKKYPNGVPAYVVADRIEAYMEENGVKLT